MQQPPANRSTFATQTTPPVGGVANGRDLPTMGDLDRLQTQLDTIDQTLADLDQSPV